MNEEIKVLIFCSGLIPSVIIGVLKPLLALKKDKKIFLKIRLSNINIFLKQEINWCDVAIFCRNTEYADLLHLYELKRLGKKVIYEIDDNFFEIPLDTPVGIYHRNYVRLYVLTRFLELADEVRVYSKIMEDICMNYNQKISLINSYFDSKLLKKIRYKKDTSKIKIVYPTGRIDSSQMEVFLSEIIKKINEKYEHLIEFHFWGNHKPKYLEIFDNIVLHKPILSYESFIKYFVSQGFDIGLAPLLEGRFYYSKTNNKYREFGGCGIAGIYPKCPPYSNGVISGYNGILVENNVDDWSNALQFLIEDNDLRKKIIKNAKSDVMQNYSFENAKEQLLTSIQNVFNKEHKSDFILNQKRKVDLVFLGSNIEIFNIIKKQVDNLKALNCSIQVNISPQMILPHQARKHLQIIQKCNFCIVQIENMQELQHLKDIFNTCLEYVLDLSVCKNIKIHQFDFYNTKLRKIILDKTCEYDYLRSNLSIPVRYVTPTFSLSTEEFSLDGYQAVYFELLDSIQGSSCDKVIFSYLLKEKLKIKYDIYFSRAKRLILFLGYRLGWKN